MSNPNVPFGARVIGRDGGAYNGITHKYVCRSSDTTPLFIGDFVVIDAIGGIPPVNEEGETLKAVKRATAGGEILGVVVGFMPVDATSLTYRPASVLRTVIVADDPDVYLDIRANGSINGSIVDNRKTANIVFGTTQTGDGYAISNMALDVSSVSVGADKQLAILAFHPDPKNEVGAYARLICRIEHGKHQLRSYTTP